MIYKLIYKTPKEFNNIVLINEDDTLIGLYFDCYENIPNVHAGDKSLFKDTINWLDEYFYNKKIIKLPKYKLNNLTNFQQEVLDVIKHIPFGETITYSRIANIIACNRGIKKMSAQAVGQALNKNPICLIIPCHRVIGSSGSLVGYAGGLNNKQNLLMHEKTQ